MSKLLGKMACSDKGLKNMEKIVKALVKGLKAMLVWIILNRKPLARVACGCGGLI